MGGMEVEKMSESRDVKIQRLILKAEDALRRNDLVGAFEVRAEMRELGFTFRLSDADNGRSGVSFFHDDAEQGLAGVATEDTDARAICVAALRAIKEKALAASG